MRASCDWPDVNEGYLYKDLIRGQRGGAGLSVLDYYTMRHKNADADTWRERIAQGMVQLNHNILTDGAVKLRSNDELAYMRAPWQEPPAPSFVDVLYEDDDIVVVDKPAGLQVLPGACFHTRTVLGLLRQHYEGSHPGKGTPVPVHRLGRGTSGLLLCAVSATARAVLASAMTHATTSADGESAGSSGNGGGTAQGMQAPVWAGVRKIYRALVEGVMADKEGEVNMPIGLVACPGLGSGLHAAKPEGGKHARSRWRVLKRMPAGHGPGRTLVEVEIFTGRPHQIRIHMAVIGHPIVGDPLFGVGGMPKLTQEVSGAGAAVDCNKSCQMMAARIGDCGYFLRAHELMIKHPRDGRLLVFKAPPCHPFDGVG